jgi:hypothetical protein
MRDNEISKLAAELFRLHLAGEHAAHDELLAGLTENQRRAVGDELIEMATKMIRLENALASDDQTAAAVVADVAAEIARFTGREPSKPH